MDYTKNYCKLLSELFERTPRGITKTFRDIEILKGDLDSDFSVLMNPQAAENDDAIFADTKANIDINTHFHYPVIRPKSEHAARSAIILLHGLNERSWDKYLPWAFSLAQQTGKSVILFPIAYHMERSPESWKNPRMMTPFVTSRGTAQPDLNESSYINIALSERLSRQPQRFFLSGYQAAQDIIKLMDNLTSGENALFDKHTHIDFFAYSIGVLLSEVLLMANPGDRFSQSKFFFFCGGSVMEGMQGSSRYILDNKAFRQLAEFYTRDIDVRSSKPDIFSDLISQTLLGKTFLQLTSFSRFRRARHKFIKRIRHQVQTICLTQDKVMPADQIRKTLAGTEVIELDFPYKYTHELPFPIRISKIDKLIDNAFEQVFRRAGLFLGA